MNQKLVRKDSQYLNNCTFKMTAPHPLPAVSQNAPTQKVRPVDSRSGNDRP
ncbi:MAG: hypothetical protein ACQES3_00480 [Pseudomonadota bacterium]